MQPGAPAFSGKDTVRGTQEEPYGVMKHCPAYRGRYDLTEANGEIMLTHHLDVSSFPNWFRSKKGRLVTFNANNLELNTADVYLVDMGSISTPL